MDFNFAAVHFDFNKKLEERKDSDMMAAFLSVFGQSVWRGGLLFGQTCNRSRIVQNAERNITSARRWLDLNTGTLTRWA